MISHDLFSYIIAKNELSTLKQPVLVSAIVICEC